MVLLLQELQHLGRFGVIFDATVSQPMSQFEELSNPPFCT